MDDVNSLLCSDYNTHFSGSSVSIGSPPNLIPFFYRNPHHHQQLFQWFGGEEIIYRAVTNYFLRPSKIVNEMKQKFIEQNFPSDSYRLGIHIRGGPDFRPSPIPDTEWNKFLECAKAIIPNDKTNVIIFVAADTPESRLKAGQIFADYKVVFYDTWLRSNNAAGVQAALTELLLLSECNNLILTPHSSYGEQAQAINGKPAYFLKSIIPQTAPMSYTSTYQIAPQCLRVQTIQPSIEGFNDMLKTATCYHPDMYSLAF
jgi:hypothetical protein